MPEDNKKDEGKIVMETNMHCDACRVKVFKAINSYPGVEDVNIDLKSNKVTLKAPNVDAKKLFETVKKKSKGKITKLVYPDPNKKEEKKKEEKKPAEVTVVLKVNMDCKKCTDKVKKAAWNLNADVRTVNATDHILTIKGWDLDPAKVCEEITKKSRKHAEIMPPKKDGDKKDGNPKKEEKEAPKIIVEYIYAPQYFSDENPNACTLM